VTSQVAAQLGDVRRDPSEPLGLHSAEEEMTTIQKKFIAWAATKGIPPEVVDVIIETAPLKSDLDPEEPYHLRHLADIRSMHGERGIPVPALASGFLLVGGCPNGDAVALDFTQNIGSIYYISHEQMYDNELRTVSVLVARDLRELKAKVYNNRRFPLDYWEACNASRHRSA
jgi:hypothetical protein